MTNSRIARILPLTLLLGPFAAVGGQEPAGGDAPASKIKASTLSDNQRKLNLESFDLIWETIRDKHFDPTLHGLDWRAVRDEFRPRAEGAASMAEAREAMSGMIDRLGQSHFGLLPRAAFDEISEEGDAAPAGNGVTGLHPRVVGDEVVVVALEEGFPAEKAGVKPGWLIRSIRGKALAPVIGEVALAFKDSTQKALRTTAAVEARLRGPVGDSIAIEFVDGDGRNVSLDVALAAPPGTPVRFGNLPTLHVEFESKAIEGGVRYIALNTFFDPARVMPLFAEAIEAAQGAPGLVLDLRGNPGGVGAMAMGIGGWLIQEKGRKLGTMITRDYKLNFTIQPRAVTFAGPVAVLVDGCSASTSEILAGGLQDLGRARVFGTPTAGAALPSVVVKLPNGDAFQYAIANYIAEGGQALEGRGVVPDEEAPPTREALLKGDDPALSAALDWIRSQSR